MVVLDRDPPDGLLDLVHDALGETGIDADSLWLEITETSLLADVKTASVALQGSARYTRHRESVAVGGSAEATMWTSTAGMSSRVSTS